MEKIGKFLEIWDSPLKKMMGTSPKMDARSCGQPLGAVVSGLLDPFDQSSMGQLWLLSGDSMGYQWDINGSSDLMGFYSDATLW